MSADGKILSAGAGKQAGRSSRQLWGDHPSPYCPIQKPVCCPSCLPELTSSYGPGPEHSGDREHEALQSVQLAGTPLPAPGGSKAREERASLIGVTANSSRSAW